MSESISPSVESLLEHAGWIRALASRLVQDPQGADDVAQDAWIKASTGTPHGSLRAWLAAIVANGARARRRSEQRRARREEHVARAEAQPSSHDLVERAELQRRLVEAVLELDEPYRTAILLRFFEEREPREIAQLLGLPDATVRTHVARGVARLRARLDHDTDRAAWSALLVPVGVHASSVPPSLLGAFLVNTPLKIGLVAAALVAVVLFVTRASTPDEAQSATKAAMPTSPTTHTGEGGSALLANAPKESERSAVSAAGPATRATDTSPAADSARVHGRVLDEHGDARSGVAVALFVAGQDHSTARAVSASGGEFEMERPHDMGRILSDDPALVTLFAGLVEGSAASTPAVVVAPSTTLRGFVVDAAGTSVADARVRVECPEEIRTRISHDLDLSQAQEWSTQSDKQGAYAFAALPNVHDARLVCTHDGFVPFTIALGDVIGGSFVITLLRPGVKEAVVRGRVVDATGVPVEAAYVALGFETTKSDDNGLFALRTDDPEGRNAELHMIPTRIVATRKGFLPGEATTTLVDGRAQWPQLVTLRLGAPALSISGTVADHTGRMRAGLRVFLADPSLFGEVDGQPAQLENLIAGTPGRIWCFVETDDNGHFKIDGLCARPYTVRVLETETLLRVDEKDVPAGTDSLALSIPRDAMYPRVAGVVRTHDGKPIADAHVFPMCDAFQVKYQGHVLGSSHQTLKGVHTDAEGRFEIKDVPKSLVYLRVERDDALPLEYGRFVEGDRDYIDSIRELPRDRIESLDIRIDLRAHVQIELLDPTLADEFALLDGDGKPLQVSVFIGNGRREDHRSPIIDGKSYVTAGTDRGKTIVLFKDGTETARRAVTLVAGETTAIKW